MNADSSGEVTLPLPPTLISWDPLTTGLADTEFVIPHIAPIGVTVLVGKPLSGKSWLSLGMAADVAQGGKVLGNILVKQAKAAYYNLSGNLTRFQTRLGKLLPQEERTPESLNIGLSLKRLNGGGLQQLDEVFDHFYPELRLLVLDSFTAIRPLPATRTSDAEALAELQFLALAYEVAIIVVSPFEIDGADATAVLEREGGSNRATLTVRGADLENDTGFTLRFDKLTGRWAIAGDLSIATLTDGRADILEVARKAEKSVTPLDVARALGRKPPAVRQTMLRMGVNKGQLRRVRNGLYTVPDRPPFSPKGNSIRRGA